MKFSEIWYVDASQQKSATKKLFLDFGLFDHFLTKKQPKLTKNEENWQNPNRLVKFSEIWCRCFPTKKCYKKIIILMSAFFGRFLTKKQPKLTKNEENWQNLNRLIKFSEILYVDTSKQKKMLQKLFFLFRHFLAFLAKKQQN